MTKAYYFGGTVNVEKLFNEGNVGEYNSRYVLSKIKGEINQVAMDALAKQDKELEMKLQAAGLEELLPYVKLPKPTSQAKRAKDLHEKIDGLILSALSRPSQKGLAISAREIAEIIEIPTDTVASYLVVLRQEGKVNAVRILEDTRMRYFLAE